MASLQPRQIISASVQAAWAVTVEVCNRVLNHAGIYGFKLINVPDPNAEQMYNALNLGILPILDSLATSPHIGPDDGLRIANIRQYIHHLRRITTAIRGGDADAFDAAVADLRAEAMP